MRRLPNLVALFIWYGIYIHIYIYTKRERERYKHWRCEWHTNCEYKNRLIKLSSKPELGGLFSTLYYGSLERQ